MAGIQAAITDGFDVYAYGSDRTKKQFLPIANRVFLSMNELMTLALARNIFIIPV